MSHNLSKAIVIDSGHFYLEIKYRFVSGVSIQIADAMNNEQYGVTIAKHSGIYFVINNNSK